MRRQRAVVLLSGGLDSSTLLHVAISEGFDPYALTVDYGQRHARELQASRAVADSARVSGYELIRVTFPELRGSALTDEIEVPKDRSKEELAEGIPLTYVPGRNTILLSLACSWAEAIDAHDVFIGVNDGDHAGYPDCRPEFIEAFRSLARVATKVAVESGTGIRIHAPLIDLSKVEILRRGLELGVDYSLTHSCYDPDSDGFSCGRCDACQLRLDAFAVVGAEDPIRYRERARHAAR